MTADLESEYGVQTLPEPTKVRNHAEVTTAVEETGDRFDGLDLVVNNSGIIGDGFDDRMEEASIVRSTSTLAVVSTDQTVRTMSSR